jgi:tetratricopeptide (TPR) repeat protein
VRRLALAAAVPLIVAAFAAPALAASARGALDDGFALFEAQRFEEAAAKFAEAATGAGAEGLDPAVAVYDRAIALLKAGKAVDAAAAFVDAARSPDARLRASAHYHRGIALATAAGAVESRGEPRKAIPLLEEALDAYESAMRIDPQDEDPKVNHELASRKLAELMAKQEPSDRSRPEGAGGSPPQQPERRETEPQPPPRQGPSAREMRPDEARTLLDAMRQQELSQRSRTRPFRGAGVPVEKNW